MSRRLSSLFCLRLWGLAFLVEFALVSAPAAEVPEPVSVRSEVGPGPYFVGQGFELRVAVIAGGQRPKLERPRIAGARICPIVTDVRPVTASSIGSVVARENLFV